MTHRPGHDAKGKRENPQLWAQLDAEAHAAKAARGRPAVDADPLAKYRDAAGTVLADPDDPWINVGSTWDHPVRVDDRRKMSDVLKDFYRLRGDSLAQLQAQLFRAGFYPGDVDFDDIDIGNHDEGSFAAYRRAVTRAAGFAEAGEEVTLADVLKTTSRPAAKKKAKGEVVVLTNPDDIRRGVEKIAREAVGHKLTDAQREAAVTLWQQLETQYQRAVDAGAATVTKPPEFGTFAEGFAEDVDPQGAFRQDAISGMNEFFGLLDGTNG